MYSIIKLLILCLAILLSTFPENYSCWILSIVVSFSYSETYCRKRKALHLWTLSSHFLSLLTSRLEAKQWTTACGATRVCWRKSRLRRHPHRTESRWTPRRAPPTCWSASVARAAARSRCAPRRFSVSCAATRLSGARLSSPLCALCLLHCTNVYAVTLSISLFCALGSRFCKCQTSAAARTRMTPSVFTSLHFCLHFTSLRFLRVECFCQSGLVDTHAHPDYSHSHSAGSASLREHMDCICTCTLHSTLQSSLWRNDQYIQ